MRFPFSAYFFLKEGFLSCQLGDLANRLLPFAVFPAALRSVHVPYLPFFLFLDVLFAFFVVAIASSPEYRSSEGLFPKNCFGSHGLIPPLPKLFFRHVDGQSPPFELRLGIVTRRCGLPFLPLFSDVDPFRL